MKIKKLIAAALCATMAISTASCFVACGSDEEPAGLGKTDSVKLSDYYNDLFESDGEIKSELVKLNLNTESYVSHNAYYTILKDTTAAKYSVYYAQTGKKESGLEYQPVAEECNFQNGWYQYFNAIRYEKNGVGGDRMYQYCAPDGTTLLDYDYYLTDSYYHSVRFSRLVRYVNGSNKPSYVLRVDATVDSANGLSTSNVAKYFKIDSGNDVVFPDYSTKPKYTEIDESEISEQSPDLADSDAVGAVPWLTPIVYTTGTDKYVSGEIGKYMYNSFGDNYYFYKNYKKTGTVNISDGEVLGFLGDNFYYYTIKPASPDSKSYNTVLQSNSTTIKANYKLYRYNIVKNSLATVNTDVLVLSLKPMYNKKKQAYDAATVTGLKRTGGVFYLMQSSSSVVSGGEDARLITDADLRVAYDVSYVSDDFSTGRNLSGDRYYFPGIQGGIITDKSLKYVCDADGVLYDSVKRIRFTGGSGKYGLLDYDGKIAVPAEYSSIERFYGGMAFCVRSEDGVGKNLLIDADGKEYELEQSAVSQGNGIYSVTTEQDGRYTIYLYNNQRVLLMSFNDLVSKSSVTINFPYVRNGSDIYMFK